MSRIFISYRRDDTTAAACAGRLYDRLTERFGKQNIFMDIDTLKAGTDFVEFINKKVGECDVLIAMIGEQWLELRDEQGNRRLDNPEDWVRLEIATALKREKILVVPAMVYGAVLPRSKDLPRPLKKLARRQALEITHKNFHHDVDSLIKDLSDQTEEEKCKAEAAAKRAAEEAERQRQAEEEQEAERAAQAGRRRKQEEQQREEERSKAEAERLAKDKAKRKPKEKRSARPIC